MGQDELLDPGPRLGRRQFLIASAATGLAVAGPINYAAIARAKQLPLATHGKFAHGVSSGMPAANSITLWTRLSEIERSSKLTLEVASDPHFRHVVHSGAVTADAKRDFTVHERVSGLKPSHEYHYRFATKHAHSHVGTFRTLPPADSDQDLKIGFFSCQSYEAGYYTALAGLVKEKDLDFVICLGDYIYERHFYPGPAGRADKTGANHDGDVQTLPEYRQKYRLYQTDKNLQALHAAYPLVSMWDDHEVEDNYAGTHQDSAEADPNDENDGVPRRVPFLTRRKNAYAAFFEAMPRLPLKGTPDRLYGAIPLGKRARLFITDERQYRDPQPCNDVQLQSCPTDLQPGRTFLGAPQKAWLKSAMASSKARWNLLASETMMMALDAPAGTHVNQDQWDGYSAEREEILTDFHDHGVKNLVVLSGDLHAFVGGNLTTTGEASGTPIGVELLGGSVTSLGLPEEEHIPAATLLALAKSSDPHVVFTDLERRGYCVIEIGKNEATAQFRSPGTTQQARSPVTTIASFKVESGTPTLHQV